jgi:DnaJ-class molecular chaperone
MNFEIALEIFNINIHDFAYDPKINKDYIKKRYHSLALQYHPDKNGNTSESNEKFQQLNEAYSYLSKQIGIEKSDIFGDKEDWVDTDSRTSYSDILQNFLMDFMDKGIYSEYVKEIVLKGCKNVSEKISKDTALDIYQFLSKHKNILHISPEIIQTMKELVMDKYKNDNVYILNPSLTELLGENQCYKMVVDNNSYYVPLWHNEVFFDTCGGSEIIVKCVPELPENMYIDEDNNLYMNIEQTLLSSITNKSLSLCVTDKMEFTIPLSSLFVRREQQVVLKNCGLYKINPNNIWNTSKKADIIVNVTFTDIHSNSTPIHSYSS